MDRPPLWIRPDGKLAFVPPEGLPKLEEKDPEAEAREFGFESPAELQNFLTQLYVDRGVDRRRAIQRQAKKLGMEPESYRQKLEAYKVEQLRKKEGRLIRFYHRTSMDAFRQVVASGALLSREKIEERNPGTAPTSWSASHNVMFTRDSFHEGKLWRPGFSAEEAGVGAKKAAAVFVFKDNLMDRPDFDVLGDYPEAEEVPLSLAEGVLVMKPEDLPRVKQILEDAGYDKLPVKLASEWRKSKEETK